MLNNKGLVVSSVLYTLLIAFLLLLGTTLAQFSSSAKIISNSTKDLVNNNELKGNMIYETYPQEVFSDFDGTYSYSYNTYGTNGPVCGTINHYLWYQKLKKNEYGQVISKIGEAADDSDTLVRIYSRYGTTFWPRDFNGTDKMKSTINRLKITECKIVGGTYDGSPITGCLKATVIDVINNFGASKVKMTLQDEGTGDTTTVDIYNPCS